MGDSSQKTASVVKIIERHCSNIPKDPCGPISGYADHIILAYDNCFQLSQKQPDVDDLQALERALNAALVSIRNLQPETSRSLNLILEATENDVTAAKAKQFQNTQTQIERKLIEKLTSPEIYSNNGLLNCRRASLENLLQGVKKLVRKSKPETRPSSRLDYHALAVIWACRKVWRENCNHTANGLKWDEHPNQPPKTIHASHKETPFASFAQALFDEFDISSRPSSALEALKRAGGEEALSLSVVHRK